MKFPAEVLRHHTAVLGKTGSGKTSTAKLIVEQAVAEDARVCVLDPVKSDWWGLTSSADGRKPGLPFQILGGPHGHVPLHDGAGAAIGELVGTGALPLSIVDMADFKAGGPNRFFNAFADSLMRKMRGVVYLVIEEAHEFAPKERSGVGDENMAVYYAKKLATAGRSKGIRLIVCSQRVQALHNAVLGSCETLIVHRFTAPADQAPVLTWLKSNVDDKARQQEISRSLRGLKTGQAWICSSEAPLELVQLPRIHTFDNSATPDGNDASAKVVTAQIDVDKLRAAVGDAVAEAEANDPKLLRAEVARLQRELSTRKPDIGIPVSEVNQRVSDAVAEALKHRDLEVNNFRNNLRGKLRDALDAIDAPNFTKPADSTAALKSSVSTQNRALATPPQPVQRRATPAPNAAINEGQQRILNAVAELASFGIKPADRPQVAFMAGYSSLSGGTGAAHVGALVEAGLLQVPAPGQVELTDIGEARATWPAGSISLGELHARALSKLDQGQRRILERLIEIYPESTTRADLAPAVGYSSLSGGTGAAHVGQLVTLRFAEVPRPGSVKAGSILFPKGLS